MYLTISRYISSDTFCSDQRIAWNNKERLLPNMYICNKYKKNAKPKDSKL